MKMSVSNWERGEENFRAVHEKWGYVPTSHGCCIKLIHGKALQIVSLQEPQMVA